MSESIQAKEVVAMTLEAIYEQHCASGSPAIRAHLPRLRALADGLDIAVEFGVKYGASSSALLMGAKRVISYDIQAKPQAMELKAAANGRWDYRIQDSREAPVTESDLIFFDSQHDFDTLKAELDRHGDSARRYLVFHDATTFGEVAADGESGRQRWTYAPGVSVPREHWGIRPAIDFFMVEHSWWQIAARYVDSHGLLVLERRPNGV